MGTQVVKGLRGIIHRERQRETGLFSLVHRMLGPSESCLQLHQDGSCKHSADTLSPADRIRKSNGHKRHHGISRLDTMTIFFTRRVVKSRHRFHMEAMGLLFLGVFTASGGQSHDSSHPVLLLPHYE